MASSDHGQAGYHPFQRKHGTPVGNRIADSSQGRYDASRRCNKVFVQGDAGSHKGTHTAVDPNGGTDPRERSPGATQEQSATRPQQPTEHLQKSPRVSPEQGTPAARRPPWQLRAHIVLIRGICAIHAETATASIASRTAANIN